MRCTPYYRRLTTHIAPPSDPPADLYHVRRLVVGLGNVGAKYDNTPHNIGFAVVDRLARLHATQPEDTIFKKWSQAHSEKTSLRLGFGSSYENHGYDMVDLQSERARAKTKENGVPFPAVEAILMKPLKFMNLSGQCIKQATQELQLNLKKPPNVTSRRDEILVITDDVTLPFGQLRISSNGSGGSHNGLKDIVNQLDGRSFIRLRIGLAPSSDVPLVMHSFVLSRWKHDELKVMPQLLDYACEAVRVYLHRGASAAACVVNGTSLREVMSREKETVPKSLQR